MFESSKIAPQIFKIDEVLKQNGFKCYLVGGSLRDLLLNKQPDEWDVATDASPGSVSSLFNKVVPTGIKYGTVTIIMDDKCFEVTTFRQDESYIDGRHPENVKFTKNLKDDLSRRDFTINAMAYDVSSEEFVDLFSGQQDIIDRIIRAVGSPVERFSEDGLRAVRACRFAAQLDFEIEEETFSAIGKTLDIVKKVAIERIHDEIIKALKAPQPSIFFEYMRKAGLLEIFIPELLGLIGINQPKEYHKHDVYWHCLYSCDEAPRENLIVRLAALLHDTGKPICQEGETFYGHEKESAQIAENILKRLRFSSNDTKAIVNLIANHMFNYESDWTDAAVRRFIRRVGKENLDDLFALRIADMKGMGSERDYGYLDELRARIDKVIEEENALHVTDLKIDGSDVINELKILPGPRVGEILSELLEKVIDDPSLNNREKLFEILRFYK